MVKIESYKDASLVNGVGVRVALALFADFILEAEKKESLKGRFNFNSKNGFHLFYPKLLV